MNVNIFLVGLALIPFDNLPFAPSVGWAAVSPIIFFAYCFFNLRLFIKIVTRNHLRILLYMSGALFFQLLLLTVYGIHLASFIDALRTIVLGLSIYFAFLIRYEICKADINHDAQILYKAYLLSFIYGLIWLAVNAISPDLAYSFFSRIQMRTYKRLAFTFTEPSFISAHTIGIMMLFTYLIHDRVFAVKFVRLGIAFMALSIFTASSARCAADSVVLMLLISARNFLPPPSSLSTHTLENIYTHKQSGIKRKSRIKKLCINILLLLTISAVFALSARLDNFTRKGANSDASGATRFFLINAAIKGFIKSNIATLAGWGMGNMVIPFREGSNDAFQDFNNSFTGEANGFRATNELETLYSFPMKLISEWGLAITALIFIYVFLGLKKRKIDIYVFISICWMYLQTDSYCFYTMWIFLYLVNYYDPQRHGISYFDIIS